MYEYKLVRVIKCPDGGIARVEDHGTGQELAQRHPDLIMYFEKGFLYVNIELPDEQFSIKRKEN